MVESKKLSQLTMFVENKEVIFDRVLKHISFFLKLSWERLLAAISFEPGNGNLWENKA
jgi:hypothetical protein